MFVLGLIIGIFIGSIIMFFIFALCKAASTYDNDNDNIELKNNDKKEDIKC